jgi:ATP-dependent DNA helicase RecG
MDLRLIQSYLQEVNSNLYNESLSLSLSDIATKMQIARGPKENVKPLNVGLLMFSKEPHKFFEGAFTNLLEFEDEAGTKYSSKIFTGPIHIQIRDILSYLQSNVIKQYISKITGKTVTNQFFNYPYQVLKEAVVNALYHRSYENPTPNEIRIFKSFKKGIDRMDDPRRIEILSYPGPLPPIDEQALVQLKIIARNYRNIRLGDWLKNLGLAEKHATGIPTIVDSLRNNGSPFPILSTDAAKSYFLVVIKIHESTPIESEDTAIELQRILLSNDQQKALELLQSAPSFELDLIKELGTSGKEIIHFLLDNELIGLKLIGQSNLLYINSLGISALKNSF